MLERNTKYREGQLRFPHRSQLCLEMIAEEGVICGQFPRLIERGSIEALFMLRKWCKRWGCFHA